MDDSGQQLATLTPSETIPTASIPCIPTAGLHTKDHTLIPFYEVTQNRDGGLVIALSWGNWEEMRSEC